MNILLHLEALLAEMIVHGKARSQGTTVIAFRKDVWLLDADDEIPDDIWDDIVKATKIKVTYGNASPYTAEVSEVAEFFENRPDVLVGEIMRNTLYLQNRGAFGLNPQSSQLVRKTLRALNLRGVDKPSINPFDDGESDYTPSIMAKGKTPSVMFHGTSAKYLAGILKKGLRPGVAPSNWAKQGITHKKLVFMDQDLHNATNHANMTGQKTQAPAIVLEFDVPDKSKLAPDYDVDVAAGLTSYGHMPSAQQAKKNGHGMRMIGKSSTMTKELGVWAYKGAILPQKIRAIYISKAEVGEGMGTRRDFVKMTPNQAKLWASVYMDFGDEAIHYTDPDSMLAMEARSKLGDLDQFFGDAFSEEDISLDGQDLEIYGASFTSGEEIELSSMARTIVFDQGEFDSATLIDQGKPVKFTDCEFTDCTFELEDRPDLDEDADPEEVEAFVKSSAFFRRMRSCSFSDCVISTADGEEVDLDDVEL